MKPPADTIDLIRSTLQTGVVSSVVEQAAATYAQLSQECAARLDRIAAMLEKGSDHQALQAAEDEPPLLELVATLSFGNEKAWLDFCQAHRLPIAPKLDAKTVQALDQLYAQGVTANHPLYKDFRAAVLSRDDEQALRIIRTILKLNPGDENARLELARLENKHWQALLEKLRTALKTDDEERIATLVEKITATVPSEKYGTSADFAQGEAAVFFGHLDAEQSDFARLTHRLANHFVVEFQDLRGLRQHGFLHEVARGLGEHVLLVGVVLGSEDLAGGAVFDEEVSAFGGHGLKGFGGHLRFLK